MRVRFISILILLASIFLVAGISSEFRYEKNGFIAEGAAILHMIEYRKIAR